ncbi:MAG: hypothetical protein ACO25B_03710 [Chitinophagaceae bacterium]
MMYMRPVPIVLILSLLLFACSRSAVVKKLAGCDSLVITYNVPDTDSVIQTVSTTETKAIQKLARFLDGKSIEPRSCGFDGNMIFYKGGRAVLPAVFSYSREDCRQFWFDLDNKTGSTRMSNEAIDFLKSLLAGSSYY